MREYNSNYLGICINNNDPQRRGRVQIFIPHIMPALYEYWNKEGKDININCVGDNLENSLTSDVIDELRKILPWAESASPILGSSSPGTLTSATLQAVAAGITGGVSTAITGAINLGKKLFEQSPTAVPPTASKDQQAIAQNAAKFGPLSPEQLTSEGKYTGKCGQGARQILGGMTNNPYFQQGLAAGSGGSANAGSLSQGNNYLQKSGLYQQPTSMPSNYVPQKGDVITGTRAGGAGHIQVYDGTGWVSDTRQKGVLTNYGNLTLHRMNDKGVASIGGTPSGETVPDEQQSQSGTIAAVSPLQSENPVEGDKEDPKYGSIADPEISGEGLPDIRVDANGRANPADVQAYLEAKMAKSPLVGKQINGMQNYGVDGSAKSWANMLTGVVKHESGFDTNSANTSDPGGSYGLAQVSSFDGSRYGANPGGGNWSSADLKDPRKNLDTMVAIFEKNVGKTNSITDAGGKGAGGYFASATMRNVAKDANGGVDPTSGSGYNSSTASVPPKTVNKSDPHGPTAVVDMNNMAKGVFSYPAPGALLWVFFQDGNPLFPVYFAANYGAAEWQSAYRYGSPGPGYQPEATPENPATSTGGIMNLNGVGGLRWENTDNPNDNTQSQKSISLFGEDGSNMFIGTGYHQIFSKFDRRDQVEGDRFQTTLGYKEEWVQGDDSKTIMGDVIIRIGNVSKPAVDAVTRIQEINKEIMKPVTESN